MRDKINSVKPVTEDKLNQTALNKLILTWNRREPNKHPLATWTLIFASIHGQNCLPHIINPAAREGTDRCGPPE